jgi:Protein of unknown function (DUF2955)
VSSASSPIFPEAVAPDPAPALRLGIFPVVILAAEFHAGTPLPFLAPLFAAILLMKNPRRPALLQLVQLYAIIMVVTYGLIWVFGALADSLASVWLILLALIALCFRRLTKTPSNIAATLALSVASLVVLPG